MGTLANVAIIGIVLIIVGVGLIAGADEAKRKGMDRDDTLIVIVDYTGFVLAIGGIGLAITAGMGVAIKAVKPSSSTVEKISAMIIVIIVIIIIWFFVTQFLRA